MRKASVQVTLNFEREDSEPEFDPNDLRWSIQDALPDSYGSFSPSHVDVGDVDEWSE